MLFSFAIYSIDNWLHLKVCQENSSEYDVRTIKKHHVSSAYLFIGNALWGICLFSLLHYAPNHLCMVNAKLKPQAS